MSEQRSRFHWKDGWFWWRNADNSVSFEQCAVDGQIISPTITIDEYSWSSIVASVSKLGETTETYYEALALHNDQLYDPYIDENGAYQPLREKETK